MVSIGSAWSGPADTNGYYRSAKIATGAYVITVGATGYQTASQSVNVSQDQISAANFLLSQAAAAVPAQTCLWSDPKTWGGTIPNASIAVSIPTPTCSAVTLDADAHARSVTIAPAGTLKASTVKDTSLTLWAGNLTVYGLADWRTTKRAVVRWTGINESGFIGGSTTVAQATDPGLWVLGSGRLLVEGRAKLAWTRLAGGAARGETHIILAEDPLGWQVGDELVVVPTLPPAASGHFDAYDYPRVTFISGRDITLDRPLAFDHPAVPVLPGKAMTAEVLNLSRNILFTGEPGKRGHVMFNMTQVPQTLRHFEVRYMGPQRPPDAAGNVGVVLGRYGLHLHMMGSAARGTVVEGVVLRDLGSRGYVPHASHGITFRNTIVHNGYDAGYWWDPTPGVAGANLGVPRDLNASDEIIYEKAVASRITIIPDYRGFGIAGFSLPMGRNLTNKCRGCVAVGVQGNKNAAGYVWGEAESNDDLKKGVWEFGLDADPTTINVAHNNKVDGAFVWQNTVQAHLIRRFVSYYNGGFGWDHGAYGNIYDIRTSVFYGNGLGSVGSRAQSLNEGPHTWADNVHDAGGREYAFVALEHRTALPVRLVRESFRNYSRAAIRFSSLDEHIRFFPHRYEILSCVFEGPGVEFWLDNDIHPDTVIVVRDARLGNFELRRRDQPGDYFEPRWNASVRRLP